MKHNKLIRDLIPEVIQQEGKIAKTHIANNDEYWQKLNEKLEEEVVAAIDDERYRNE